MNLQDIAHINLYLSSMDLFGPINLVYNSFFGPSPPTRACISSILAKDFYVKMDVLAYREESAEPRSALHVRSLSYWAPANIGPYSQAVRVGERLFVAGQIGLIPPSLTLPQPMSLAMEAALSLQHESRIVKAVQEGTGGGFQVAVDSCICWVSGPPNTFQSKLFAARLAWSKWLRIQQYGKDTQVPFLIIQVPGLPKGAQIEWQMTWRAGQSIKDTEDDETPASIKTSLLLFENAGETTLPPQAGTAFSVRIFHKMTVAPDAGKSLVWEQVDHC